MDEMPGKPLFIGKAKLSDEDVLDILTLYDHLTMRQVGDMFGVSSSAIQKLRRGETYRWVAPEIERTVRRASVGPRCPQCVHDHIGACGLGVPERLTFYGDRAATVCAAYCAIIGSSEAQG
jgi:hypothetical protein